MSKKIILASSSPRRKELLSLANVSYSVKVPDLDETPIPGESPLKMVKRLSFEKAQAVFHQLEGKPTLLILAADTTVVSANGEILGKPRTHKEARKMIANLQGRPHRVHTGYALLESLKGRLIRKSIKSVTTRVFIRALSEREIRAYVNKGESLDKAGAYAAQGFGMTLIEKLEGSYTNVVGLPMAEVLKDLKSFGWKA